MVKVILNDFKALNNDNSCRNKNNNVSGYDYFHNGNRFKQIDKNNKNVELYILLADKDD